MPFDPENRKDVSRLIESARRSRRKWADHRTIADKFQRVYVGRNYSEIRAPHSTPVNVVEQLVNIYKRALVPSLPSAFVRVDDPSLLGTRSKLELATNHTAREIGLESTMELVIFDALMLMAVVKVALKEADFRYQGYRHNEGQPFVDHILRDDWLHDYSAKSWEVMEYAGDRSFDVLEMVQDTYPKHADKLSAVELREFDQDTAGKGDPIDRTLAGGQRVSDYVGIWQIWKPREKMILVMPDDRGVPGLPVLESFAWEGPEVGPYHQLGFEFLPGSTIPLSPIATLFELAKLHGALFRKVARQSEHQKTVLGARRSSAADAAKLTRASDMEVVTVDDPSLIKDFRFNGADPATLQMESLVRQLFSEGAGNLQLLGGLGPQAETLGQDRLNAENASQRMKGMQKRVNGFLGGVFRSVTWWLFHDSRIDLPLIKPNPGAVAGIRLRLTPEDMEGDFLDYNIEVNPYSMQSRTPQEELNLLMNIMNTMVFPFPDQLAQQGVTINWPKLLRRVAELSNIKGIDEYLMFTGQAAPPKGSVGSPPQTIRFPGVPPANPGGREFQQAGGDMASVLRMISGQGGGQGAALASA